MSFDWPEGWEQKPLEALCERVSVGHVGETSSFFVESEGIPLLRSQNVRPNKVELSDIKFITLDFHAKSKKSQLRGGDLLIVRVGQNRGDCAVLPHGMGEINCANIVFARPDPSYSDFLGAYFNTPHGNEALLSLSSGSAQLVLNTKAVAKIQVPVPPANEALAIGFLSRTFDDRISLLRETNTTLEAIAQALFKSWFVDFDPVRAKMEGRAPEGMDAATAALFPDSFEESELGEVPKGWRVGTVADIGEVICGKTPPTSETANYGDDVPFITIPDMHNLLAVTTTNRSLSSLGAATQKKKTLPSGSVCVSCIATAGLVVRVTTPSQTNQQINSVVPLAEWGQSFPLFTLRRIGDAVRAGGSGGSVFHNLSKSGFEQLKVLFPSEQLAIAFGEVVESIIEKIITNQKQAQTLATLRDTLLPRLISGQLRLPDAHEFLELPK